MFSRSVAIADTGLDQGPLKGHESPSAEARGLEPVAAIFTAPSHHTGVGPWHGLYVSLWASLCIFVGFSRT